jgi:hypothetical protein
MYMHVCLQQGDQIVRIFAHWLTVRFGQFFLNIIKVAQFLGLVFHVLGYAFILTKIG